jgi:hypothetical protein
MSRRFLYRSLGPAVIGILALLASATPRSAAQGRPQLKRPEEIPQEEPPEPKKKKVKGPRAVGILQLSGNGKGTLVPIAILIDGKFYDASAYKADPVPMALDSGTVYEVEQAGDSQGLFTVSGALHSKTPGSSHEWVGAGAYLPNGTEAAKATRKAEDVPVGLDNSDSDAPPRLTRGNSSKAGDTAPKPSAAPSSGTAAPANPTTGPSSGTAAPATAGSTEKPGDTGPPASSPPASGASGTASEQTSQGGGSQSSQGQTAENYYRPTLRRGKPTQPSPEEEEPAPKSGKPESPAAAASAGPVQLVPAISDAGGPDPQSYKFFWKTGEEEERRNQMLALAANEIVAYAAAQARNRIPAKPLAATKATSAGHRAAAKAPQPVFENLQFRVFDVWRNNQPVMILSAEAHFPPTPGASTAPESYSITLLAKTDIYGDLRKLYAGVTDKFHLDVTPRLELIDVVDADGDGRGELLFRETTDAGSGYVIYRATADKLWKMFDSMAAE